jgi:hypothetical protein
MSDPRERAARFDAGVDKEVRMVTGGFGVQHFGNRVIAAASRAIPEMALSLRTGALRRRVTGVVDHLLTGVDTAGGQLPVRGRTQLVNGVLVPITAPVRTQAGDARLAHAPTLQGPART